MYVYIYYRFMCIIDLYSIVKRSILWCTVSYVHLHCFPDVFPSGVGFPRHSLGLTVIVWTITIAVYPCQAVPKKCQPCKIIGHCTWSLVIFRLLLCWSSSPFCLSENTHTFQNRESWNRAMALKATSKIFPEDITHLCIYIYMYICI